MDNKVLARELVKLAKTLQESKTASTYGMAANDAIDSIRAFIQYSARMRDKSHVDVKEIQDIAERCQDLAMSAEMRFNEERGQA